MSDIYFEDEWYEDYEDQMTDEEWADYCAWLEELNSNESTADDQPLTTPSPTDEDRHEL